MKYKRQNKKNVMIQNHLAISHCSSNTTIVANECCLTL